MVTLEIDSVPYRAHKMERVGEDKWNVKILMPKEPHLEISWKDILLARARDQQFTLEMIALGENCRLQRTQWGRCAPIYNEEGGGGGRRSSRCDEILRCISFVSWVGGTIPAHEKDNGGFFLQR